MNAQEVIIVEGEKDCDCLANMGFTATTCAMGAKKWKPQYNACLQGKNVVLIPDNDNEGREHMLQVAVSLDGTTSSLKLLDLPGLPSKGDVSDWAGNFQEPDDASERLAVMIDNAPPYEPEKPKTVEDAVIEAGEFARLEIGTKSSFVEPWLTEQSIGLISGWRGTGKTWLALSLLDAVTKGESFGPWRVETSVPCLFLDGEMPVGDIQERLNSLDPNPHRVCPLYVYSDCYANQLGLPRAHLAHENWRQTIKRILTIKGVKLWVIDNLASLASGLDESSKRDFDPINQFLLELRFQGISTIMLHHMNKEGGQRGTSAREDNIDFSISLKTPTDYTPEDGCRFILHFTKSRVRTKDLSLVADVEFRLAEDEASQALWVYGNVKQQRKREVLRLFDQGMDAKAICETVDLSKGYVSKIRKKAIEDGLITSKGNLTPDGFMFVNQV
jgi:putative DNA primase/helicase